MARPFIPTLQPEPNSVPSPHLRVNPEPNSAGLGTPAPNQGYQITGQGGYDPIYAEKLKNTTFTPVAPGKTWGGYFNELGSDIEYNELKGYTDQWGADPEFPWHLMIQDYLNWGAGGKRIASVGEGGRLEMDGDVLGQDIIGEATPTSMAEFGWDDATISDYTEGVTEGRKGLYDRYQAENILPLYDLPDQVLKNTQRGGLGKGPASERPPVGFGGSLLSDGGGLTPFGAAGTSEEEIPLSAAQQLIGGR